MNQFLANNQQLSAILQEVAKLFSTKAGIKNIIQILIFELLRRKLPALVKLVQGFLFGSNAFVKVRGYTGKLCNFSQEKSKEEDEEEEEMKLEDPKKVNYQNIKEQKKKLLKEIMHSFFQENWKDNADHIRQEVVYHFNIEKQLNDINQNLNIEKKLNQWETLKKEVFSFLPFSIVTSTLLICTELLREVLKKKYQDSLKMDYPSLHDPQEITNYILNEFFEQINLIGMKNVKAFVKQKLSKNLQDLSLQESIHTEKIFEEMDEYLLELMKSNSCLKKPVDHKKRSSMTLFRNNRTKKSNSQLSPINFCEYNDGPYQENGSSLLLHDLITQRANKEGKIRTSPESENSAIFANHQPIIAPHTKLDIIYLYLGDISENKILTDTEFIEKHIEIADCKCREQRYQPSLQCIPEAEDDGYESDKSEQLPHSSNSQGNGGSSGDQRVLQQQKQYVHSKFHRHQQGFDETRKQRKYSDGASSKNGINSQDEYYSKKERYQEDNDEEEEEEDDDDEEENGYTKNDQFLLELKGQKKKAVKKNSHLLDQHHQANQQRRDLQFQLGQKNGNNSNNEFPISPIKIKPKGKKNQIDFNAGYDISPNFYKRELPEEDEDDSKALKQLTLKTRFLSQEDGDEEDYNPQYNQQKKGLNRQNKYEREENHASNDGHLFIQNKSSPYRGGAFETQEFIPSDHEGNTVIDEEEIIENRQRLTHFLQSLCYEALEILESANFQTYLYYAVLFQYKKFKNRFRLHIYENNLPKHLVLMNIITQIHKITEDHFLSSDAQEKCELIYLKYKNEVESIMKDKLNKPPQQQIQIITRIFEEVDQSITIRESFEELTRFFIES